ncbi:hypothetical protein ACFW1A_14730 [Kitasatospora sp. NPDC058965]|uniref:hypothetical protein n=1 Tax=Kitasatospora sp. NPDC058965 TaxID=3346682 RepID=UPI0036CF9B61
MTTSTSASYRGLAVEEWNTEDETLALVLPGHVPSRVALAAVSRHVRTMWGRDLPVTPRPPEHVHVRLVACSDPECECADGWEHYPQVFERPEPGSHPATVIPLLGLGSWEQWNAVA